MIKREIVTPRHSTHDDQIPRSLCRSRISSESSSIRLNPVLITTSIGPARECSIGSGSGTRMEIQTVIQEQTTAESSQIVVWLTRRIQGSDFAYKINLTHAQRQAKVPLGRSNYLRRAPQYAFSQPENVIIDPMYLIPQPGPRLASLRENKAKPTEFGRFQHESPEPGNFGGTELIWPGF
ncbi:hypothetical protein C8R44DRAFT_742891 [Mycena epipterygia]|nr:hypothetical protein C8R44DRAFT_742891 [Mycena epipterygia]